MTMPPTRNPKTRFLVLAVPIVVIMAFASYVLAQAGVWGLVASVASGVFALLVIAFAVVIVSPGRRPLGVLADRGGIGLSNSPSFASLAVTAGAAFYMFVLGLVLLWAATGDRPSAAGPIVLLAGVAAAGIPTVIALARRRIRLGGLVVTPEAVHYASYTTVTSIPWTKVTSVRAMASKGGIVNSEGVTVIGTDATIDIPCDMLRTDADDLLRLLSFYQQHPRARVELSGSRSLDRISSTDLRSA